MHGRRSDLIKDLIAFDTTSRGSNLALIDYAQELLDESGRALPPHL